MKVDTVLAPNPGPYTGQGTNTYVLTSNNQAIVIDPATGRSYGGADARRSGTVVGLPRR